MIFYDVTKSAATGHRSGLMRVNSRLREEMGGAISPVQWGNWNRAAGPNDWFFTAELFSEAERPGLRDFLSRRKCRCAALYFDAIPLKHPSITWPRSVARHPDYLKLLSGFDRIWAISAASREELIGFWRWAGLERPPPVETVALGADFTSPPAAEIGQGAAVEGDDSNCPGRLPTLPVFAAAKAGEDRRVVTRVQRMKTGGAYKAASPGRPELANAQSVRQAGRPGAAQRRTMRPTTSASGAYPGNLSHCRVESGPALICVGILEPRKNQAFLLAVCEELWTEDLRFELHLVGRPNPNFSGPLVRQIKALRGRGLALHHHGAAGDAEVAQLYSGARASVVPSLAEGCGLPLLESLWMGVPCVCSDLPALLENTGGGGCLPVALNQRAAWKSALRRILTDDALHRRLAAEAASRQLPTWSEASRTILDGLAR